MVGVVVVCGAPIDEEDLHPNAGKETLPRVCDVNNPSRVSPRSQPLTAQIAPENHLKTGLGQLSRAEAVR